MTWQNFMNEIRFHSESKSLSENGFNQGGGRDPAANSSSLLLYIHPSISRLLTSQRRQPRRLSVRSDDEDGASISKIVMSSGFCHDSDPERKSYLPYLYIIIYQATSRPAALRDLGLFSHPVANPSLLLLFVVVVSGCVVLPRTWERGLLGGATLRHQPACFRLCHERHAHAR